MILEQIFLYVIGFTAIVISFKWGLIPAFKWMFAPQLRELEAKRKKRIAEANLEAEKLEAEAINIQVHQDEIARESIEVLLHAGDDKHEHKHVH
jgi:hypothetical protein